MRLAFVVLAVSAFASVAHAQIDPCASSTGRRVQVSGSAQIRATPDRATFTVGVSTEAPAVAQAFASNAARVQAVISALKSKGASSKEIQTSNLDVQPVLSDDGRKTVAYRVSNQVTVTRNDTESVGQLLQAAVEAGANNAGGLSFSVADTSKNQARGLELAFQDARSKAETLASAAGAKVGDAICVSESYGMQPGPMNTLAFNKAMFSAPIEAGSEFLNYGVQATFELKAR